MDSTEETVYDQILTDSKRKNISPGKNHIEGNDAMKKKEKREEEGGLKKFLIKEFFQFQSN